MTGDVLVEVAAQDGVEDDDLADVVAELWRELLELDLERVEPAPESIAVDGAKGIGAAAGWLWVTLGKEGLGSFVAAVRDWAGRRRRSVRVVIGQDVLELNGATPEQQDRIVEAFLAAHPPGS